MIGYNNKELYLNGMNIVKQDHKKYIKLLIIVMEYFKIIFKKIKDQE